MRPPHALEPTVFARSTLLTALLVLVPACHSSWDATWYPRGPGADPDTAVPDLDQDGDGWSSPEDCDDEDPSVHPDAEEHCDGVDEDCDGAVDEDPVDAGSWYADGDGDGWGTDNHSELACTQPSGKVAEAGDCDDGDPSVHPGADETCNGQDDDCDHEIDEDVIDGETWYTDADGDGWGDPHAAIRACEQPSDSVEEDWAGDCDDTDPAVHPDASEQLDGLDNDCNGEIDEGTTAWDDDGDCACELAPCTGSAEPSCTALEGGDCDDGDASIGPGAWDEPDPSYVDADCDGIDGDADGSVFVDPYDGDDLNDGLSTSTAVATLDTGIAIALAEGLDWLLIAEGTVELLGSFEEGVHLAGGYDAMASWSRDPAILPVIPLPADGALIEGWSAATEWQQLELHAASATGYIGAASIALRVHDTRGLRLQSCAIYAGQGAPGSQGSDGVGGAAGSHGSDGDDGCHACETCSDPGPGGGGTGCAGADGGDGGDSGWGWGAGSDGSWGLLGGGSGGPGGLAYSDGDDGGAGSAGGAGSDGAGGDEAGRFDATGYTPADGDSGGVGSTGRGGGGGGGGGGGTDYVVCISYGGGGGGGGGGGCGGGPADGGGGGGASVGLLLVDASVELLDCQLETAGGGQGGRGGAGGSGGSGGAGGAGGGGTDLLSAGAGGTGGLGGGGGRGGHGGGGGGGPSYGVRCEGSASLAHDAATTFSAGAGGTGGSSAGENGQEGDRDDTSGC